MTDREKVIYDIERCICHVPDACKDCSKYGGDNAIRCMEELLTDVLSLLKAQEPQKAEWTTKRTQEHDGEWYCSHCGYEPVVMWGENFCPNCGYKMTMPEPPKEET